MNMNSGKLKSSFNKRGLQLNQHRASVRAANSSSQLKGADGNVARTSDRTLGQKVKSMSRKETTYLGLMSGRSLQHH